MKILSNSLLNYFFPKIPMNKKATAMVRRGWRISPILFRSQMDVRYKFTEIQRFKKQPRNNRRLLVYPVNWLVTLNCGQTTQRPSLGVTGWAWRTNNSLSNATVWLTILNCITIATTGQKLIKLWEIKNMVANDFIFKKIEIGNLFSAKRNKFH